MLIEALMFREKRASMTDISLLSSYVYLVGKHLPVIDTGSIWFDLSPEKTSSGSLCLFLVRYFISFTSHLFTLALCWFTVDVYLYS